MPPVAPEIVIVPLLAPQVAAVVAAVMAVGAANIVTDEVVVDVHPPLAVTVCVTVYVPAAAYVMPVGLTAVDDDGVPPVNVQLCEDPFTPVLVKLKELPLRHWLADCVKVDVGCGFTVIVYVTGVPAHPDNVGVTVIVPVIGLEVALVAVNEGTVVDPLAASPIAVLEFVQANEAPVGELVKLCAAMEAPAHTLILEGAVMVGTGFTTTAVVAVHVAAPFVTVTVYVPAIAVVEPGRVGFCAVDVKPPGPDQLYVPPPVEFSWIVDPAQYAPVLLAVAVQVLQAAGEV